MDLSDVVALFKRARDNLPPTFPHSLEPIEPSCLQSTCDICASIYLIPVQTSCGHMFCVRCLILAICESSNVICPCCRTGISWLMPVYALERQLKSLKVVCKECGVSGDFDNLRGITCPSVKEQLDDGYVYQSPISKFPNDEGLEQIAKIVTRSTNVAGSSLQFTDWSLEPITEYAGFFAEYWETRRRSQFWFFAGRSNPGRCPHCARKTRHSYSKCKWKFLRCRLCQRKGHIQYNCPQWID